MYLLQLFDDAHPAQPVDARLLRDGMLRIGRDGAADWTINDPDRALSRMHCEIAAASGRLRVRAIGTNGVFDAITGARFPQDADAVVALPADLRFGRFVLRVTLAQHVDDAADVAGTMVLTPPLGHSAATPDDWTDAAPVPPHAGGSLLEAFCEGAGLDASLLAGDDAQEVMRRAGAVYRQMVLGIGDLMSERDRARRHYEMTRTTIGAQDNNPFKWAPSQRLAVDLLLERSGGFLSGAAALQTSFRDIKRHLIATFAGLHGSLRAAIDTFDPAALGAAAEKRATLLRGRAAAGNDEAGERHADLMRQVEGGERGSLDHAFIAAYERADAAAAREAAR